MAGNAIEVDMSKVRAVMRRMGDAMYASKLLKAVALRYLKWIDDNFKTAGALGKRWPPLRPGTVASRAARGRSGPPLLVTGKLRGSFHVLHKSEGSITVGSVDVRAPWHHYGTRPYTIRPKRARVLRFFTEHGEAFAKFVRHPGLPARQLIPTRGQAEDMALAVIKAAAERASRG